MNVVKTIDSSGVCRTFRLLGRGRWEKADDIPNGMTHEAKGNRGRVFNNMEGTMQRNAERNN